MKITTIIGARPQFIKAAAVSRAISSYNQGVMEREYIREHIVHTGQHFDQNMSEIFFKELGIPTPDSNLNINNLSHGAMTGQMLEKIEEILIQASPDWVLIYGDTNSTIAGALAAAKLHIPIAHVEAGLRSFNRLMPEEINRVVADHLSTILFCPTDGSVENLKAECITIGVEKVGDVMLDAFLYYKAQAQCTSKILEALNLVSKEYYLATVHRAENTEQPEKIENILDAFQKIGTPSCPIVFPVHPRTKAKILKRYEEIISDHRLLFINPVSYFDMILLLSNAKAVITDSGGLQKEAYFADIPCITLRDETEWVETVETGWNLLAGSETERILHAVNELENLKLKKSLSLYGDGNASSNIIQGLIR